MVNSPIVLALDSSKLQRCEELITETRDFIGVYKLGLEFFTANGIYGVERIRERFPKISIFLDLKLHDIPNTVRKASENLVGLGLDYLTVHASGGADMVEAAAQALPETNVTAVTLLTSLDRRALADLKISAEVEDLVLTWALNSVKAGAKAIVASPLEVSILRKSLPDYVKLITPGIRLAPTEDDQKRVMSPSEALKAGSDLLVIGRPITGATHPGVAAKLIFETLK